MNLRGQLLRDIWQKNRLERSSGIVMEVGRRPGQTMKDKGGITENIKSFKKNRGGKKKWRTWDLVM